MMPVMRNSLPLEVLDAPPAGGRAEADAVGDLRVREAALLLQYLQYPLVESIHIKIPRNSILIEIITKYIS